MRNLPLTRVVLAAVTIALPPFGARDLGYFKASGGAKGPATKL